MRSVSRAVRWPPTRDFATIGPGGEHARFQDPTKPTAEERQRAAGLMLIAAETLEAGHV